MGDVDAWIGKELTGNRYRVDAKLGEGGMAVVYRAYDNDLETEVVIKVPRPDRLSASHSVVKRFGSEIRALVHGQGYVHRDVKLIEDHGRVELVGASTTRIKARRPKITFNLNAERMPPEQVHAFVVVWLLVSCPAYDDD